MNPLAAWWQHIVHLFKKDAPKIEAVLQPEIDLLQSLIQKFAAVDLSTVVTTVLAGITANNPFGAVVAAGATALKAQVAAQSIEATEDELQLVASAVAKHQANGLNASIADAQKAAALAGAQAGAAT